jgi:autotransporter-associated beta strand protein
LCAAAAAALSAGPAFAGLGGTETFIPISTSAYGYDDTNSCGVTRNNLVTIGNYQYTAYYQYDSDGEGTIYVGRRATNSTSWTLVNTHYNVSSTGDSLYSGGIDDHDVVAMAVAGNGDIQLSWGMHNIPLNYAISTPANGSTFNPVFTTQTATNNPTLFSQFTSSGISQVTYPEFYYIPAANGTPSGNLVFDYRNAAAASGGGSGNGNTYFGIYNYGSSSFTAPGEVLDGGITSVNGYQNRLAYDSNGNLDMTWTWRSTPNFQTNNDIMFAQSPNNGVTWYQQGGATQYTLPIIANTSNGGSGSQVAQVVETIGQNSSIINQSSMTVDKNNNPVLATWLTPNGNASLPVSATNNPNLQYELIYYNGSSWQMSQITHRTSDTSFDQGGSFVRDLGRPIVLVDSQNRVLVIGRSEDAGMGSYSNPATPNNNLTVYWNTMSGLDSASPQPWKSFPLDTANMGEYEPSYDPTAWTASNQLNLFYEPVGLTGETTGTASVLQWNESSFNFATATPSVMSWDADTTTAGVQDGSGIWNLTDTNFSDGYANYSWNTTFATSAIFGGSNGAAGTVTLGANVSATSLIFDPAGSGTYNIAGGGFTLNLGTGATISGTAGNALISAPITMTGTLTKTGTGTVTLSGNNSLGTSVVIGTGATSGGNVDGALCIDTAAALGGVTTVSLTDNNSAYAVFQLNGSTGNITLPASVGFSLNANNDGPSASGATILESIAGNNVIAGTLTFNVGGKGYGISADSGSLTFTAPQVTTAHTLFLRGAGSGAFTAAISGPGSIEVDGPGTWTLSGTDTFTGTTTVAGGTLNISTGASVTSTSVTVDVGGILNVAGTLSTGSTVTAAGTVNFLPGNGTAIINRTVASLVIPAGGVVGVQHSTTAGRTLLVPQAFYLAGATDQWQGRLDLSDNDLDLPGVSLATITNQVAQGYDLPGGGNWNGTGGITSTAAGGDTSHLTALGVIQNNQSGSPVFNSSSPFDGRTPGATDILIKYTWYGDANLSGTVDGSDYSLIDAGFASNGSKTGWYYGDFNYDGFVDGSDYALIDNAFNDQNGTLSPDGLSAAVTARTAGPAAVPEPTGLTALAAAALAAVRRRRHRPAGFFATVQHRR